MRIFHMADLHIGKKLNQVSLLPDQQHLLQQVVALIQQRRPDVLLLAGDIYDRYSFWTASFRRWCCAVMCR